MKGDWLNWLANSMKAVGVVVVALGLYGWAQESASKHAELCSVIESHMLYLEEADSDDLRNERKAADRVWWDNCSESDQPS